MAGKLRAEKRAPREVLFHRIGKRVWGRSVHGDRYPYGQRALYPHHLDAMLVMRRPTKRLAEDVILVASSSVFSPFLQSIKGNQLMKWQKLLKFYKPEWTVCSLFTIDVHIPKLDVAGFESRPPLHFSITWEPNRFLVVPCTH